MARLIINPLSNYEMVKSNEISATRFLMSTLPIPLILCLFAPQMITSAYVMLLQAYTTHEYETFFVWHTLFLPLTDVQENEIMRLFPSASRGVNAFGFLNFIGLS